MGELIMLKNDGQIESFDETIRVVYENGGTIKTDDFKDAIKRIHPHLSSTSCNHKTEASRYFGFVLANNNTHLLFLTELGYKYYKATTQNKKIDIVINSLKAVTFGRYNNAVNSDSDVEAPVVMLKVIARLGTASMTEIGLILYYMDTEGITLSDAFSQT